VAISQFETTGVTCNVTGGGFAFTSSTSVAV
jgi:hypothetical protein